MKKLVNRPEDVIEEMLTGIVLLNPRLARLTSHNVLLDLGLLEKRDRLVTLISGGGSGHEPAHAGYIGEGMLSAAVPGGIFTSPSVDSIFAAIRAVAGKPGVLLIVKNYTGDRLNFGLAAEMAHAEGIPVKMVLVADDVALRAKQEPVGARGLAGTVLVHKIAGAAAAEGKNLDEVYAAAQSAADAMGTMGISLSAGTSPLVGKPSFVLGNNEVELGLGIHGEPGVRRIPLAPADQITDLLVDAIVSQISQRPKQRLALMINNLGATTAMELAIVGRRVFDNLAHRGHTIERIYSGTFLSSLDMSGVSLTVLPVDDQRLRYLDAATSAPAWPNAPRERPTPASERVLGFVASTATSSDEPRPARTEAGKQTERAIRAACAALREAEARLTELDQFAGDGDLGISMARGADAVERALPTWDVDNIAATLKNIGDTLRSELGGASGPLYGVLFLRAAAVLGQAKQRNLLEWGRSIQAGADAVAELGGARLGDRTMLDALVPFAQILSRETAGGRTPRELLESALKAAENGAEGTAAMLPRRGRSSYLGERVLGHPDPGAVALCIWLRAVVTSLFPEIG